MPRPIVFENVDGSHPVFEHVLALAAHRHGTQDVYASGSALFIAPGLAITALHVLQDYSTRMAGKELSRNGDEVGYSLHARQVVDGEPVMWRAKSFTAANPLDLAVLSLERANGTLPPASWGSPRIRFTPPPVGSQVLAIGFPDQQITMNEPDLIRWESNACVADGDVDELHLEYRDVGRLRFPCFRTNARFDGGMSGGPVITAQGEVCGIICSNLPPSAADEEHVSYASLLWPMLGVRIPEPMFAMKSPRPLRLRHLFEEGYLKSHDWQKVRSGSDERVIGLMRD